MSTQITASQAVALPSNPGQKLEPQAADAWERVTKAYGKRVLLTDSFRPYEVQERIFRERYVQGYWVGKGGFTSDVRTWNGQKWTRKAGTAAAAVPGTSNHGGGRAVDVKTARSAGDPSREYAVIFTGFSDPDRTAWLKVAAEHGWSDAEGRLVNEPWHMTYYPEKDQHRGTVKQTRPTLKRGDKGTQVGVLQAALNAQGQALIVDNDFGAKTELAVKLVQAAHGLVTDGIVGAKTWDVLGY